MPDEFQKMPAEASNSGRHICRYRRTDGSHGTQVASVIHAQIVQTRCKHQRSVTTSQVIPNMKHISMSRQPEQSKPSPVTLRCSVYCPPEYSWSENFSVHTSPAPTEKENKSKYIHSKTSGFASDCRITAYSWQGIFGVDYTQHLGAQHRHSA